jgi:hypothetical protein
MAKGAFGQKQGEGALAMRWPKEEGTDFAGHEMAKGHEASLAIRWPKRAIPLHGQRGGDALWPKGEGRRR